MEKLWLSWAISCSRPNAVVAEERMSFGKVFGGQQVQFSMLCVQKNMGFVAWRTLSLRE